MRSIGYAVLGAFILAVLAALSAACGDGGEQARTDALRAAVAALKPDAAEMSDAEMGACGDYSKRQPSCISVNFFFLASTGI